MRSSRSSENGGAAKLRAYGVEDVDIVPLGVELGDFGPSRRDQQLRRSLGLADGQPLLIYVGRLDAEKKPHIVVEAFRSLPESLGARLVLLGEGPLREEIAALGDPRILTPGYRARPSASSRSGWRAPTSMCRQWPTRHSACRSSKRRPRACRSSASPPGR